MRPTGKTYGAHYTKYYLFCSGFSLELLDSFCQLGDDGVHVANNAQVCDVKDGGCVVLVDSDDEVGAFHTCRVLDSTGDTACNVQVGVDSLTCLTDLAILCDPAGVNAGAFFDNATSAPEVGATPEGLVFSKGVCKWTAGSPPNDKGFAGFNKDDILVVAKENLTKAQAEELNIRDGCCFGPVLIMNGEINQEAYNSNSGWNPRTAIGQRKDGAVVFVCIDGRQAGSAGGTYKDVIDIMIEYGVVNACNMDGGSSSIMVYRDTYGLFGEAGTVQVINSYSLLQERPRKMPTFWMVAP